MRKRSRRYFVLLFASGFCAAGVISLFAYARACDQRIVLSAVGMSLDDGEAYITYLGNFGSDGIDLWEINNSAKNLSIIKHLDQCKYPVRVNQFDLLEKIIGETFGESLDLYCTKHQSIVVYLTNTRNKIYVIRHPLLSSI